MTTRRLFTIGASALAATGCAHMETSASPIVETSNTESVNIAAGNAEAQALSVKASAAWANFARNGAPAAYGLPAWPQYSLDNRETMILSADPHVENDPMGQDRLMRERLARG